MCLLVNNLHVNRTFIVLVSVHSTAQCITFLCVFVTFKVEVEALVVQGPKLTTGLGQVKKLEATVLVFGQKKPSALSW